MSEQGVNVKFENGSAGYERPKPVKIAVIGVGGGGGNAIEMICEEKNNNAKSVFNDTNIKIIAANTDIQVLEKIKGAELLQLGPRLTKGQGAGGIPECGRNAAEESRMAIASAIDGCDMVFITAGMGGGTGTGAAPVIAKIAKEADILTVGIVTKPLFFEGDKKMELAENGIKELIDNVDSLVVVPNDRLLEIAGDDDDTIDMFKKPNEILIYAVRSISELIMNTGYINVDFADVKATMSNMGLAVIGFGSATGDNAMLNAIKDALNNPLLKNFAINGSKKMLVYVSGARTKMREFVVAGDYLKKLMAKNADCKYGVFADDAETNVSVLIVTDAHEVDPDTLKETKKTEETFSQGRIFEVESAAARKTQEDIVIEVQSMPLINEDIIAPAAKNDSLNPVSVKVKETKQYHRYDAVLLPEPDLDVNGRNAATFRTRSKKNDIDSIQSSITECEFKK